MFVLMLNSETNIIVLLLILIAAVVPMLHAKYRRLFEANRKAMSKYIAWKTRCACNEDNLNYMSDRLAHFAAKVFGQEIPKYEDGTELRPGDVVTFIAILGGNSYEGIVDVNMNDMGEMENRCPVVLTVRDGGVNGSDRRFDFSQITGLKLTHRPECFHELMSSQKPES